MATTLTLSVKTHLHSFLPRYWHSQKRTAELWCGPLPLKPWPTAQINHTPVDVETPVIVLGVFCLGGPTRSRANDGSSPPPDYSLCNDSWETFTTQVSETPTVSDKKREDTVGVTNEKLVEERNTTKKVYFSFPFLWSKGMGDWYGCLPKHFFLHFR